MYTHVKWKQKKIWQKKSHLEFHSIFNQDGITNSPKNLQFQRAKRIKLAHLLRSFFKKPVQVWLKTSWTFKGRSFLCFFISKQKQETNKKGNRGEKTWRNCWLFFCSLVRERTSAEERWNWWHHQISTKTALCHPLPTVWSYVLT